MYLSSGFVYVKKVILIQLANIDLNMDQLTNNLLNYINDPARKSLLVQAISVCCLRIKETDTHLDLKSLDTRQIIEMAVAIKEPMAYILASLFSITGMFEFEINFKRSFELAEKLKMLKDNEFLDFSNMILAYINLVGIGDQYQN